MLWSLVIPCAGSLRSLTTERLGAIQHALLADHFFHPDLLNRENRVPAILLNGTVVVPQTRARASKVNIVGVADGFFGFWEEAAPPNLNKIEGQPFNGIVINEALQNELNVHIGDALLVNMSQAADIHPEFLLGERDAAKAIQSLRVVISDIIPTENFGRFSPQANQSLPFNAFISLPILQNALGQAEKVNAIFTTDTDALSADDLALTFTALDLNIKADENHLDLQSDQYLLKPIFSETALKVAARRRMPTFPTLTYLANTISANGKTVPYSTIVALPMGKGAFAELLDKHITQSDRLAYVAAYKQETERLKPEISEERKKRDEELDRIEEEINRLKETWAEQGKTTEYKQRLAEVDIALTEVRNALKARRAPIPYEIVLNAWTAADLEVKVGDKINITYYRVGVDEAYITETASFLLKGILPIEGIAADSGIIPTFPGIHDTADMSEWESPFPIDYTLISRQRRSLLGCIQSDSESIYSVDNRQTALEKSVWRSHIDSDGGCTGYRHSRHTDAF